MKISVIQADNIVVVDGEARKVDLSDLDPTIYAIQFDTNKDGWIEYDQEATQEVEVRDFEAEARAMQEARKNNRRLPEGPIMKRIRQSIPNKNISDYNIVAKYVERWTLAAPQIPAPTPKELIERRRIEALDQQVTDAVLGEARPANLEALRTMSSSELAAWFDDNFRSEPQRRELLRWMLFALIRRF